MQTFLFTILLKLAQIRLFGLDEAAEKGTLFAVLVTVVVVLSVVIITLWKEGKIKSKKIIELHENHTKEIKQIHELHTTNIKEIGEKYFDKYEEVIKEMRRKEDDRNKQWLESEKETLNVLNGVTSILEMSEKMGESDNKHIMDKLKDIELKIDKK
ncbi:MAG: hypothetical protein ACOCV1_06155 [Bacillota bacterium]